MKWILSLLILLCSLTISAQSLYRDSVHYSLPQYRAQRNWSLAAKNTIVLQDSTIKSQDSTIVILENRIELRDTIIAQKNETIKSISNVVPKIKDYQKSLPWIFGLGGLVLGCLITKP